MKKFNKGKPESTHLTIKNGLHIMVAVTFFSILFYSFLHILPKEERLYGMNDQKQKVRIFNSHTGKVTLVDKVYKSTQEWKKQLTPEQYRITRKKGTERAFVGKYNNHKEKGIYKCVCCGTDLFGSDTKFESGTGWPSFWAPISNLNIRTQPDNTLFIRRTEVLCARCDAHLGHVFDDGPPPTHKRYCLNSDALQFVKSDSYLKP